MTAPNGTGQEGRRLTFLPSSPEVLNTRMAGFEYREGARSDLWERCLREWIPDPDMRDWLQRFCGYCCTGYTTEQVFLILYGEGANGKSVFVDTLLHVMGSYSLSMEPSTFLEGKEDKVRDDLADMRGVRLVVTTELPSGKRLDEALIKRMTGDSNIRTRRLYGRYFTFTPTFKVMMVTNHKPVIRGAEHAIWRRIRLLPFTVTIPPERQDRLLLEKLKAERDGVGSWLLEGWEQWLRRGLNPVPSGMGLAEETYRAEMDTLADFVEDTLEREEGQRVRTGAVYTRYAEWSRRIGQRPISASRLVDELRQRRFPTSASRGYLWYNNTKLKEPSPSSPAPAGGPGTGEEAIEIELDRG